MALDLTDDPTVPDTAKLWRRLNPEWVMWDAKRATYRVTSQAFQDKPDVETGIRSMSVWLDFVAMEHNLTPRDMIAGMEECGVVALSVGDARKRGLAIVRRPRPEAPPHAWAHGNKRKVRKLLAYETDLEILIHVPGKGPHDGPPGE